MQRFKWCRADDSARLLSDIRADREIWPNRSSDLALRSRAPIEVAHGQRPPRRDGRANADACLRSNGRRRHEWSIMTSDQIARFMSRSALPCAIFSRSAGETGRASRNARARALEANG